MRGKSAYVPWELRKAILERDKVCCRCGRRVRYYIGADGGGNAAWRAYDDQGGSFHFDHVLPVSKGGKTALENIQLLCQRCNLSKGDSI